jgi:hypothetical protein
VWEGGREGGRKWLMVGTRGASIGEGGSRHGMCEIKVKSQIKLEILLDGKGEKGRQDLK